jgi:uncharacterized membrane protein
MAVDTRDKRFSMFSMGRPWVPTLPNPDGGFASAADRQHIVYLYRGIEASVATTLVGRWSNVIDCRSANQRIDCQSSNQRIDL